MTCIRCIARFIICVVIVEAVSLPGVSRAESILLAQLYHARSQPDDAGETFRFSFHTAASAQDQAEVSRPPTPADVGLTFAADPATVAKFDSILTIATRAILVDSGFGIAIPMEAAVQEFFDGPFMGEFPTMPTPETDRFIMKAFVPQAGPNFSGYRITGVDQTIDGMSIRQLNPSTFLYWGAQTIRIFGERIPEPATLLPAAIATTLFLLRRNRHESSPHGRFEA